MVVGSVIIVAVGLALEGGVFLQLNVHAFGQCLDGHFRQLRHEELLGREGLDLCLDLYASL